MNMELRPSLKQTITHQMIQSSEILQMNNMELEVYLQNLALENPLLDFAEPPEEDIRKKEWLNALDEHNKRVAVAIFKWLLQHILCMLPETAYFFSVTEIGI